MTSSIAPLLTAFRLGNVTCRNRFAMSPMTRCFCPEGVPGRDVADYYRRRADGEVGLIVTEGVGIDHPASIGGGSINERNVPVLHGEAALAGWRHVVNEVHAAGSVIFPQLWHMGPIRQDGTGDFPQALSCRPSGVWGPQGRNSMRPEYIARVMAPTRPMTESEIADVIAGFARSAANAKAVGFDGIAIHAAHGYLIDSFFWSETNRRTDQWGGDLVGRTRFGAEVVKAIRAATGPDLPIMFRYSQWKQQDYDAQLARDPKELEQFLRPLIDAGVDVFDASTRLFDKPAFAGSDVTFAGWTRKISGKPTMAVGGVGLNNDLYASLAGGSQGVNNLDAVLCRFDKGEFDLIAVGRALLVDPDWVSKARTGAPFQAFDRKSAATLY